MTLNNNKIKQETINYAQIFYSLKIFNFQKINKKKKLHKIKEKKTTKLNMCKCRSYRIHTKSNVLPIDSFFLKIKSKIIHIVIMKNIDSHNYS